MTLAGSHGLDTCLELPLVYSHKAHFLGQHSPGDVGDPTKPPAQWPTQPEWKEPDRPVNPNGHLSVEETGSERRCYCPQVAQQLSQLDLKLGCSHFIILFSLPP